VSGAHNPACESFSLEGLKPECPFSAQQLLFPFQNFPTREPNDPPRFVPNKNDALPLAIDSSDPLITHRLA
jgi:hypothetical protein